jgi:hypothetical protein
MSEGTTLANDIPKQLSDGNSVGTTLGLAGIMSSSGVGDKISFFGATPVTQPASPTGNVHTPTVGSTTAVFVNTTFDGSIGTTAYTIGDLVIALKNLGLIAL